MTPRKQMELALRESEMRHQTALKAINESVYEWDIVSGAMYYSPRLHSAVGWAPEELRTSDDWLCRIHPDDLPGFRASMRAHLKGETPRWRWNIAIGTPTAPGTGRASMAWRCAMRTVARPALQVPQET